MRDLDELWDDERASAAHGSEEQWISLSDLMTSLMLIFMLLAIAYMMKTATETQKFTAKIQRDAAQMQKTAAQIKDIAVVYEQAKSELHDDLAKEFKEDFPRWGASLDDNLSIRFDNQYILFNRGQDAVKEGFQGILRDFFPRYLDIITSPKYRDSIQEVRIEGHTSSIWSAGISPQEAYFKNMELSQARTRSVLRFVMGLPEVQAETVWLQRYVTANGLSSSHLVVNADGTENEALSQRVEFRIRTDADGKIKTILDSTK